MIDPQPIPRFRATDDLKDILGDLRSSSGHSQSQVAQLLGCAHTTITRYESGQITPEPGYVAFLMRQLWEGGAQQGRWDSAVQVLLFRAVNQIIERFYPGTAIYTSWPDLVAASEQFVEAFRHSRRSHLVLPKAATADRPGKIRQITQTITQKIASLQMGRPIDRCAAQLLCCAAYLSAGEPIPMALLQACAPASCPDPEAAIARLRALGLLSSSDQHDPQPAMIAVPALIADLAKHTIALSAIEGELEAGVLAYTGMALRGRDPAVLQQLHPIVRRIADRALLRQDQAAVELSYSVGWLLCLQSEYTSARYYLEHALHRAERCGPAESELVLRCLNALAVLYQCQGLMAHAQRTIERVIAGWQQYAQTAYQISTAQNNLGRILLDRGDFRAAYALFEQALPACVAERGARSDETARIFSNIGYCATLGGPTEEARTALLNALEIRRAVHPPMHPTIAFTLSYLGLLELREGHVAQAVATLKEATAMLAACYGDDYTDLSEPLRYLGVAQCAAGQREAGRSAIWRSLVLAEHGLGRDHLEYVRTLDLLVQGGAYAGDPAQQQAALRQIESIYREQLVGDHPDTARIQGTLQGGATPQSLLVIPNLVMAAIPIA
jgi:tetratricopeptide (TPR) repeat protein/transcriptional regulator with XRE-family HTH domain